MKAIYEQGYFYEIAGLIYYVFFLVLMRGKNAQRYTQRTRALVLIAAIVLVGTVPLHYAGTAAGQAAMLLFALAGIVSAFVDARAA
jgi:uncharacterized membrane protein